ncbi:hypothetical protein MoryE10_16100 [Methylogaea oryzae]|uniref:Uncharacterized protein n=1 Tax=Methylogaea oryzae TaxID=1295382 RepID=A0A8D4VPJ0_9GAMM|nr:hypothetical protein MoryE10_16100 [Methylogaea oryzae]
MSVLLLSKPAQINIPLPTDQIKRHEGCAYTVDIPPHNDSLFWTFEGDSTKGVFSKLRLYENKIQLGPNNTAYADIQTKGRGAYSHWQNELYFSTSDCSSPVVNGKLYKIKIPPRLSPAGNAIIFGIFIAFSFFASHSGLLKKIAETRNRLTNFLRNSAPRSTEIAIAAILTSAVCAYIFHQWFNDITTNSFSLGGRYVVSDGLGYYECANSLIEKGRFDYDWCDRRVIYPYLLAGFSSITENLAGTLILQGLTVTLCLYLAAKHLYRHLGLGSAILFTGFLLNYAASEVFATTTTENAGLMFGALGMAFLLSSAKMLDANNQGPASLAQKPISDAPFALILLGLGTISIALSARAGAMFCLPLLFCWSWLMLRRRFELRWHHFALLFLALVAGNITQVILLKASGATPGNSYGNFSLTLYGLSVGGKNWNQFFLDHPGLTFQSDAQASSTAYKMAFENIVTRPEKLFEGLIHNISIFLENGTVGYYRYGAFQSFASILWWTGLWPIVLYRRRALFSLIGLMSLGVVLTAPLLMEDAGSRVFAASATADFAQITIGCWWLLTIYLRFVEAPSFAQIKRLFFSSTFDVVANTDYERKAPYQTSKTFEQAMIALLVVIMAAPVCIKRPTPFDASYKCASGELAVTQLGKRSQGVIFSSNAGSTDFTHRLWVADRKRLQENVPAIMWWKDDLKSAQLTSIVSGTQINRVGGVYAFSEKDLTPYIGKIVNICINRSSTQKLFGLDYSRIESIEIAGDSN